MFGPLLTVRAALFHAIIHWQTHIMRDLAVRIKRQLFEEAFFNPPLAILNLTLFQVL